VYCFSDTSVSKDCMALVSSAEPHCEPALPHNVQEMLEPALPHNVQEMLEPALPHNVQEMLEAALPHNVQEKLEPALPHNVQEKLEPALPHNVQEMLVTDLSTIVVIINPVGQLPFEFSVLLYECEDINKVSVRNNHFFIQTCRSEEHSTSLVTDDLN